MIGEDPTREYEVDGASRDFSLLGGPLHRLGCRVGLVRNGTNTVPLGLAIGLVLWGILILLGVLQGIGHRLFSLSLIAGHVRLLAALPLFFLCETWLAPRMAAFIAAIVGSGVVPGSSLPGLDREIGRIARLRDSWLAEAVFLAASVLLIWAGTVVDLPGASATHDLANGGPISLAGRWYWFVCLPLFRFLLFRWLWRLLLWCLFLRGIARLNLHLVPTHPDGVAGLGVLEIVQGHFTPLALAISAVISASFAEEMAAGTRTCASLYPAAAAILASDAVLFLGPLCVFASKLYACRMKGISDYMTFAARYVDDFDKKWLRSDAGAAESPLGTADLQSLADLSNSVKVVQTMRCVPGSLRMVSSLAAAALLPLLPLLLFEYPMAELAEKLLKALSGL